MLTRRDAIKLKCDILVNGIRVADLRKDLQRDQGWDEARAQAFLPAEMRLPHEVYCQVREHSEANFRLRIVDGELVIQDRANALVCKCTFVSLPEFAHSVAADGTLFQNIVVYNGTCNLNFTWNYYCDYFRTKQECRFCNLTPAQDFYPDENISNARKTADQIGDVIEVARAAHPNPKSIMTRGTPHDKHGHGGTIQMLDMLSARFPYTNDRERTKVLMTVTPTKNIADVKLLYDAGLHSVSFNFEVFDRGYWKAIVPGKDSYIGRDLWEASLVEAVKHFGPGRVFSALIAGLEPRKTLLEGVHWCCDRGIIPIIVPFSPETGSQFEGFRPPTLQWMMATHLEAAAIIAEKLPFIATAEYWELDAPICAECFTGGILFDVIKTNAGIASDHGGCGMVHATAKVRPAQEQEPVGVEFSN